MEKIHPFIFYWFWILLTFTAPSIASEMTINQYKELESSAVNKNSGSPIVNVYLSAVLDSYGISNAILNKKNQQPLYCQPDTLALAPMNLRQLINDRLKVDRTLMSQQDWDVYGKTMTISGEAILALQNAFPCNSM